MTSQAPTPDESSAAARKRPPVERSSKKSETKNESESQNGQEEETYEIRSGRFLVSTAAPSWLFSLLMHVGIVLVAAFFVLPRPPASKSISFNGAPPSDSLSESVDISLDSFDEVSEPASEMAASLPTEVTEPVEVVTPEATVDVGQILASAETSTDFSSEPLESNSVSTSSETSIRTGNGRGEAVRKYGGSAGSEAAVKAALKWIVDHQLPDGGWDLNHQLGPGKRTSPDPGSIPDSRNAATALALLPLLGDGQTHQSGEHKDVVFNGLKFLLERGRAEGNGISFYERGGTMYSHGLVSIVLSEVYAMTEDPELAPFAQKAINYIESVQNETDGGWGYGHSRHRPAHVSDTSIVGWQLMALKSAIGSGLRVRPVTMKRTKKYLAHIANPDISYFGYDKKPPKESTRLRACTSIGLLSSMYLGSDKDSDEIRKGVERLAGWGPDNASSGKKKKSRVVNMYYNYYATQVMKQYGGDFWKTWNVGMRDYLVKEQAREGPEAGSWMFDERFTKKAGRLYATSLSCMTLEVYYRFLPLYKESILDDDFPL